VVGGELANILKYLINRCVELRESHALLGLFIRSPSGCAEAGLGSTMWRDASLSVSTASARMCKGDTSELPESPLLGLYSTRWSSGLVMVYATEVSLVAGEGAVVSPPLCASVIGPEGCKFRDEANIAAITCSPTGDSWIRCKSFSTVSGLLSG
jgi:hypothetical protein